MRDISFINLREALRNFREWRFRYWQEISQPEYWQKGGKGSTRKKPKVRSDEKLNDTPFVMVVIESQKENVIAAVSPRVTK
jgi:hypothetical protein